MIFSRRALRERPNISTGNRIEVDLSALGAIVERSKGVLTAEEHQQLKGAVETLAFLTRELESKSTSLERLRRFLFGGSEKTSKVLGEQPSTAPEAGEDGGIGGEAGAPEKRKGHGRNGADKFPAAKTARPSCTWRRFASAWRMRTDPLYGISCADANTATAVGVSGTILRTNTGGKQLSRRAVLDATFRPT